MAERTFVPLANGDVHTDGDSLRVFLATWNVNCASPDIDDVRKWLSLSKDAASKVDVFAIGLQEFDLTARAFVYADDTIRAKWIDAIEKVLGDNFVQLAEVRLAGMLLVVYATGHVAGEARDVGASYVGCGLRVMPYYQLGNKGGLAVRFDYKGKSVCILSCHLAAHSHYCQRRNRDFHRIVRRLRLGESPFYAGSHPVLSHDCVFVMGDLNYRICLPSEEARRLAMAGDLGALSACDQLRLQQQYGRSFVGFDEAPLTFPPTYKYDVGSAQFDSSDKARGPAWCDRILWKATGVSVWPIVYQSHPSILSSDHRPITGFYEVSLTGLHSTAAHSHSPLASSSPLPFSDKRSGDDGHGLLANGDAHAHDANGTGHPPARQHGWVEGVRRPLLAAIDSLLRALVVTSAVVALFLGTPRPGEPLPRCATRVTGVIGAGGASGSRSAGADGRPRHWVRGLLSTEGMGHERLFPRSAADLRANRPLSLAFLALPLLFEGVVGIAYGISHWLRVCLALIVLAPPTRLSSLAYLVLWIGVTWPAVAAVAMVCVWDGLRARRHLAAAVFPAWHGRPADTRA